MAGHKTQAHDELTMPLLSGVEDHCDALPVFIGSSGSDDFRGGAEVRFISLENKTVFDKVQSRSGNVAKQRVCDGVIQMEAVSPVGQILSIRTWVFREPSAAELHRDRNGSVELPVTYGQHSIEKLFFSVNLDSVYDGPIAPVYELAKVEMDKRNLFQLLVELSFHNGAEEETQSFYSTPFLIRSRPRNNAKKPKPGTKRPRTVPESTEEEEDSSGHYSPDSSVSMAGSAEFQNLRVLDHLEAKRAHIEHLSFVVSDAGARKADIGYHFKLKDPDLCEEFEEGDVVGFFGGDDGRASIQLLDNKRGKDAIMAGVISRSAYLEATPSISEDDPTDVVCVIGIIKVKCMGSVRAGERIYASVDFDNPGTAIPESHLPPSVLLGKTSILLGMAMEEKKASRLDDIHLVQCFVCIVLGVCDKEIASEIESMYNHFEMDLAVRLRRERKKTRRLMCVMGFSIIILLILVAVFMYEFLYPGSALRYWICKQGSIPGHMAEFRYIPSSQIHQRCDARGLEFTWNGLLQKMSPHLEGILPMNSTAVPGKHHYYLNWDRCAHGGANKLSALVQGISNNKQICGPIIFSTNFNCSSVYYHQDAPHKGWKIYKSVGYYPELHKYLKCTPEKDFE